MTLNKLASQIAKREGKKHQASIGDIREILKILVELEAEDIVAQKPQSIIFSLLGDEALKRAEKLMAKLKKAKKP